MIRILLSIGMIIGTVAFVAGGTTAFLSDTESSIDNVFAAGAIDLKIDNESYYNGAFNDGTSWELADLSDGQGPGPNGSYLFFNFLDVKPDDEGEDTISIHVNDNDAWACMDITLTSADDNGCTEPEAEDGDTSCGDPGLDEGELQNELNFVWWHDDGDNVLEDNESEEIFYQDALANMSQSVVLADANGQGILSSEPLLGGETYYVGKAWCFGTLTIDPVDQDGLGNNGDNGPLDRGTGIICDGTHLDNTTQTDSVTGDIVFNAVQSRHNDGFVCNDNGGGIGCSEQADVMLVLDRSGSVSGDLDTLKDAAKAFVTSLAPSSDGVHIGITSFASAGSLDLHLTDDTTAINAAIDGLAAGGSTNLAAGISLADGELDNPGDGHDRDDADSPDFMVIITDGEPNVGGDGSAEATAAKADGIEIFAVGVDIDSDDADHLRDNIVSPPPDQHYFDAADFSALEDILEDLTMCEEEIT